MRYSADSAIDPSVPIQPQDDNRAFFAAVARQVNTKSLAGALLFVGARDPRSLALRRAQGVLRYDRTASLWSHVALLVSAAQGIENAVGVEVSLDPEGRQLPQHNGVSPFRLARYLDSERYPNLALVVPKLGKEAQKQGGVQAIVQAALAPNRDRVRFPLWDGLATWAAYAYAPDARANPLLSAVPMPSAALVEYAYGAVGIDLTPGATADQTAPELLWVTVRRWATRLEEFGGTELSAFNILRDKYAIPEESSGALADEPILRQSLKPETSKRQTSKRQTSKRQTSKRQTSKRQ